MSLQSEMLDFRARRNLSQEKSAILAGITKQTWYSVEKGQQTPSRLTERKIRNVIGKEEDNESISKQN